MEEYIGTGKIHLQDTLTDSFNSLSPDILCYGADTLHHEINRYRHFSNLTYQNHEFVVTSFPASTFNLYKSIHAQHLNTLPAPINKSALAALQQIVGALLRPLSVSSDRYQIGFNQIRMLSYHHKLSYVAPGYHQDGYDFSLHICIKRHNIIGGISKLARDVKGLVPVSEMSLQDCEYIWFDDKYYYHTATPIQCKSKESIGYRDMIIVDIIRDQL